MQQPFILIDSKITIRDEFQMNEGYQPTNAIFVLKKGSFEIDINGVTSLINAGDVVILPDYVRFKRRILSHTEFFYIKFRLNDKCPFKPVIPYGKMDIKDKTRIYSDLELYERIPDSDPKYALYFKTHIMEDILYQVLLEQSLSAQEASISDRVTAAAAEFISKSYDRRITLADICAAAGCNSTTLNTKFNSAFGMPPIGYLISLRLKRAEDLLLGSSYTLEFIAEKCGFSSVYYFSTSFKKKYGVSPSAYRRMYI